MDIHDILEEMLDKLYQHQDVVAKRSDKLDNVIDSINEFLDEPDGD